MDNEFKNSTEEKNNVVVPTNDFVFKRIFGREENKEITKDLLSCIIEDEIVSINLEGNTILDGDILNDKMSILDIKAEINNRVQIDIEMQMATQDYIEERMLYYWSKLYNRTVPKGDVYKSSKRTIAILIADFELKNLKDIEMYHTKWKITETKISSKVLTDKFEIDIIELPKARKFLEIKGIKNKNQKLLTWLKFLINPESVGVAEMEENEEVKKAQEELEKLKQDEIEWWRAEMRQKFIADEKVRRISALEEGEEKGIAKGSKDKQIEIAKKLLDKKMSVSDIAEVTGLTEEEINKLAI